MPPYTTKWEKFLERSKRKLVSKLTRKGYRTYQHHSYEIFINNEWEPNKTSRKLILWHNTSTRPFVTKG